MNKPKLSAMSLSLFRTRLSLRDQALFAKRLSLLSRAGVTLLESINIMNRQSKGARKKMYEEIENDLANGQYLSKSLARHHHSFGNFAINIIRVGETTGTLSDNLLYLSEEIDKKRELRGKVIGALIYPIIIMVSALAIAGFLTIYLFPKLMPVFQSLNVKLPITTRALIWISTFLIAYGPWIIAGLVVGLIALFIALRDERVRFIFDHFLLKIPVMGDVLQHYHISNTCRTMGLLLKSNVRVLESVTVAAETSSNLPYRYALAHLKTAITKGSNIAKQLEKKPGLFPIMLTEMIAIGEKTGNLSETFLYLSGIYEQELDEKTKRLSSTIEPAMMLGMGLLVGFIAVSIITPIYEVTQHLQPR